MQFLREVNAQHTDLLTRYTSRLLRLNFAKTTQRNYAATLRRFFRYFPNVPLETLTPEHLERYLWSRALSPRSIWTELETVRAFFSWLVKHERYLRKNPCDGVERPRWQERMRPAPAWLDILALLRFCRTTEEQVIVETLFFTGLRISELRSLHWREVDLDRRRIRVVGKGGKERIVVFPVRLATLLRRFAHGAPDAWFLASPINKGYARAPEWIEAVLLRLEKAAGLPYHLTAHVLRHGWVRLCKTRGLPVEVTAKLAGHSNIQTTVKVYGQMDIDDLQAAYDRHIGA